VSYEYAVAVFSMMLPHEQTAVVHVFNNIKSAFHDVRDAFAQAVADEALVIETEMLLLGSPEPPQ
jgi:hypothetical protein